ncbi:MAG: 1-deoxy-D-xylulose-5-phosphate synthase [Nitrospirae bacterium]|nr:1-deoxy-D-xylulose-5-phosphate synthase [Nitrospirota bacterium]
MRAAFFNTLEELYHQNEETVVLTADLGFKLFDNIKSRCSERFYDVGIAEANMVGLAAGLALSGKNVYCYSIIPFLIMRAFEQIRIDVAYHNLNVKLVGVGGGFTYGFEGITHFGLEDLALMRSLPNMTIVIPADPFEASCIARLSQEVKGPLYIRLGRSGDPFVHDRQPDFKIGKAITISEGSDIAIFATGNMVYTGRQVSEMLKQRGVSASLYNMHTLKPLDTEIINHAASLHDGIFSLEEHNINGGLGSAISEVLAETRYNGIFRRIGITEMPRTSVGDSDFLRQHYGLTPEKIYNTILNAMEE